MCLFVPFYVCLLELAILKYSCGFFSPSFKQVIAYPGWSSYFFPLGGSHVMKKQLFISIMFWLLISIYLSLLVNFLHCPPQLFSQQFVHLVSMRTASLYLYSVKTAMHWVVISDGIRSIIHITFIWGRLKFHCVPNPEMHLIYITIPPSKKDLRTLHICPPCTQQFHTLST